MGVPTVDTYDVTWTYAWSIMVEYTSMRMYYTPIACTYVVCVRTELVPHIPAYPLCYRPHLSCYCD